MQDSQEILKKILEKNETNEKLSNLNIANPNAIPPSEMLKFAGKILFGCAFLFVLGMWAKVYYHDIETFNACKTILPPIVTLIIGYYFSEINR